MKRATVILAALTIVLVFAISPALSASLGISPSSVEIDVPGDGSVTADLKAYYFSGDIEVTLVDIPLEVEPKVLHVDALNEPDDIQVTIYGDESLGSQIYNGYIKFVGMSGDMIAIAVQVKARVTHIVEGQPVPEEPEQQPEQKSNPEENTLDGTANEASIPQEMEGNPSNSESNDWPVIPVAGIAAGAIVAIALIFMLLRRPRY
ncbi:MAG: hypothetical protein R6U89_07555 [Dehalococcoidia bacterium]